jgi:hypothetical protein
MSDWEALWSHESSVLEYETIRLFTTLKQTKGFNFLDTQRSALSQDYQEKLYTTWWPSLASRIKRIGPWWWMWFSFWRLIPTPTNIRINAFSHISPLLRIMVHMWLLKKPSWISDETLAANIREDSRSLQQQFTMTKIACTVVPMLRPALPLVQKLEPFFKLWIDLQEKILLRLHNQYHSPSLHDIQDTTAQSLVDTIEHDS